MDNITRIMLEAGIRAPSGDNCQPWRFDLDTDTQLRIHIFPAAAHSFFDLDLRASYLSIGAVYENMRSAAGFYGRTLRIEYCQATEENAHLAARIHIVPPGRSEPHPCSAVLYHAMLKRSVNRRTYLPMPLFASTWQKLLTDIAVPGLQVMSYTKGAERSALHRIVQLAETIRWDHSQIHKELFSALRYNRQEAENSKDGLQIDRLGIGPFATSIMHFLGSWPRLQQLKRYGLVSLLAWQSRLLMFTSSGLVAVWIDEDSPAAWMRGGEVVERLWNRAQQLGLQVQPLPVAFYLHRRFILEGGKHFTTDHCHTLRQIESLLKPLQPQKSSQGLMLFRIGRGWPMQQGAVRKPLEHFLIHTGNQGIKPGSSKP